MLIYLLTFYLFDDIQGVKCPIYSYIWKTVLYIPIFQGKQEMLNSYFKTNVVNFKHGKV